MYEKINPEYFDAEKNKWILEVVMTNGYVQVIEFVNTKSLNDYRTELAEYINKRQRAR